MATHSSILAWKSHGQRSLVHYSPWGCKEPDTTQQLNREECSSRETARVKLFGVLCSRNTQEARSVCSSLTECPGPLCLDPSAPSVCQSLSRVRLFVTPMDGSPPGSSVHGMLQTRRLEWVAISFSRFKHIQDRIGQECV